MLSFVCASFRPEKLEIGLLMRLEQATKLLPADLFCYDLYSGGHEGETPPSHGCFEDACVCTELHTLLSVDIQFSHTSYNQHF